MDAKPSYSLFSFFGDHPIGTEVSSPCATDIPEQNLNPVNTFDLFNRTFLWTYSNSFGNHKLKSTRERGTGAEEEKMRVQ